MATRAKPKKRAFEPEDLLSSGSDSDETTPVVITQKKRTVRDGGATTSGNDEGGDYVSVADDPEASDIEPPTLIKRPKSRRGMRDDDGLSDSESEELDSAKLFTLLYTIYDNVKKNTKTLRQLQHAQTTQHSRYRKTTFKVP